MTNLRCQLWQEALDNFVGVIRGKGETTPKQPIVKTSDDPPWVVNIKIDEF